MTPSDTAHPEGETRPEQLPCPFRGSRPTWAGQNKATGAWWISCTHCAAEMEGGSRALVVAAWNTRPVVRPQGEEGLWRPISEAPKDGTPFDAWVPDAFGGHRMVGLSFNRRGELRQHGRLTKAELPRWPTHWQPLPAPPALSNQGKPSS